MTLICKVTASDSTITVSAVGTVTDRTPNDGIFAASNGGIRGYQFQLLRRGRSNSIERLDARLPIPYKSKLYI